MFTIDKYVVAESLEQAYELNKSKKNKIIGGMLWLKMGRKKIGTAIDLSSLGLNAIEENDQYFKIGCMCTLRDMETNKNLNKYFNNLFKFSLENIVGVQMRNLATIGGSIYSRFGFSDILTALLVLDTYVELHKGGIIPLEKYMDMPLDNDILINIIIKKDNRKSNFSSLRLSATDFPVLTCAISNKGNEWYAAIGARPLQAKISKFILIPEPNNTEIMKAISTALENISFGSNMRASKQYREILAPVFMKRGIEKILYDVENECENGGENNGN